MKQPKKRPKGGGLTATQLAQLAGLSVSRVYVLLNEGRSPFQILLSAQRRREKEQAAAREVAIDVDGIAQLVTGKANGSVPANGLPTYAESLRTKEFHLSQLRQIEVLKAQGELILASDVRLFASGLLIEARRILDAGPSELADQLAAEASPIRVEALLRVWLERSLERFCALEIWSRRPAGPMPV